MVLFASVEGQDDWYHLALGQWFVPRLIGRNGGHGQLTCLDRLRLGEPGKVDFLNQVGEGLGFELGTAQSFLGPHDEDLVKSLDG